MKRLADTFLKTACVNRAATVAGMVDSALRVVVGLVLSFSFFDDNPTLAVPLDYFKFLLRLA
jgi:hypothetical protein